MSKQEQKNLFPPTNVPTTHQYRVAIAIGEYISGQHYDPIIDGAISMYSGIKPHRNRNLLEHYPEIGEVLAFLVRAGLTGDAAIDVLERARSEAARLTNEEDEMYRHEETGT